jgi:prepilin-type processing-associated H-X9-DG protein
MCESFLRLLACSDAYHAPSAARMDPAWIMAGTFAAALTVILSIRALRRPGVLVTYGVVVALTLLLVPAVQAAREAARRTSCTCNLKQFGLALHNYHDTYGCFPPASINDEHGRPMHSWRVLLLPYMCGKQIYDQYDFNEPWDGPHNRLLADQMPPMYRCPSDDVSKPGETSYAAVVGPETIWPDDEIVQLADVTDGTENTLVIVEVAGNGIHWMEPRDLPARVAGAGINKAPGLGICSRHPRAAMVVYADGSVHALNEVIESTTLNALATRAGGEILPPIRNP